jgi:hypothetical protein
MREWVNEWVQEGNLWVWRYKDPSRNCRGWHFAADPAGCRSVRNLLDRMSGDMACHRTLRLCAVTDEVLAVPNYGKKALGSYDRLRIDFEPGATELSLSPEADRLTLVVGNSVLPELAAAFASVEAGGGDFGIATSNNRRADPWMFWWPPRRYYPRRGDGISE